MKTIVAISDTHGNVSVIDKLLPIINESTYCVHLGDYQRDIWAYRNDINCSLCSVKGNCDGGGEDDIFEIDDIKVLACHGDRYDVKTSLYKLYLRAKEVGAKLVFYGHTHNAEVIEKDGIYFVNPGANTLYGQKSYAYVVIYNGKIDCKIVNI